VSPNDRAKLDPKYGKGEVTLELGDLSMMGTDEVVAQLTEVFQSPSYNPPRLPASATQLLDMTRNADVDVKEVTKLLEQDQLLAAEVLKIAQSAAVSGQGEPVRTLDEALVRLGLRRTADIFLQACMQMRVFRVKGYQRFMDELRKHSVAVAYIARHVSRQTSLYDEHAFLCGLLHDAGIAAALIAVADSTPRGKKPPDFSDIWEPIRRSHEVAGAVLGKIWDLPPEVTFVMEHHHSFMVGGYPHPTSCVIELSNALAEAAGFGFGQESLPDSVEKAVAGLGLSPDDVPKLQEKALDIVSSLA